ncbi:AMP-binding protein, partial [Kitasatospora sp. NPDC059803]|uniref:AMP-binding protein n=1 Tax=Kitasatospora sp. NPDC059803 TaxID=3346953 RepID=UPI0036466D95
MDDAADSAQGVRTDVNSGRHAVVRNDSGQYAIWPGDLTVPGGWHLVYGPAGRDDCRAHVAREWRPPGLGFPGLGSPGERGRGRAAGGGGTVHGLLRSRAAQHPDAVAVAADDATLSYRELDRRSDRLARALRARGVGPEEVVPVCLERGAGLVVAWLGVLKAGAALLPLDPAYPARRLARLVEDSGARVAVTEGGALPGVEPLPVDGVDGVDGAGGPDGAGEPDGAGPDDLAYLIYTSGTTGTPKGVPVTHRALVFTLDRVVHAYGLAPGERVLQLAALGFDTALEQVFATLLAGATLVLGGGRTWAPTELVHRMRGLGLAVADLTPAYWHHVLTLLPPGGPGPEGLRLGEVGGDRLHAHDGRRCLVRRPGGR